MTEKLLFTNISKNGKISLSARWWTNEGEEFSRTIQKAIEPIIKEYAKQGYNLRELKYIIDTTAESVILRTYIGDDMERRDLNRKDGTT